MSAGGIASVVLALAITGGVLQAQDRPPVRPEVRVDATSARVNRLELSGGAAMPIGSYVRLAFLAGAGIARGNERNGVAPQDQPAARADVIARFQLDPFHQSARGLYGGGGVSYLASKGERGRLYLSLVAGVELRNRGHVAPAFEVGLGGGVRVGFALRRATTAWR